MDGRRKHERTDLRKNNVTLAIHTMRGGDVASLVEFHPLVKENMA